MRTDRYLKRGFKRPPQEEWHAFLVELEERGWIETLEALPNVSDELIVLTEEGERQRLLLSSLLGPPSDTADDLSQLVRYLWDHRAFQREFIRRLPR